MLGANVFLYSSSTRAVNTSNTRRTNSCAMYWSLIQAYIMQVTRVTSMGLWQGGNYGITPIIVRAQWLSGHEGWRLHDDTEIWMKPPLLFKQKIKYNCLQLVGRVGAEHRMITWLAVACCRARRSSSNGRAEGPMSHVTQQLSRHSSRPWPWQWELSACVTSWRYGECSTTTLRLALIRSLQMETYIVHRGEPGTE